MTPTPHSFSGGSHPAEEPSVVFWPTCDVIYAAPNIPDLSFYELERLRAEFNQVSSRYWLDAAASVSEASW